MGPVLRWKMEAAPLAQRGPAGNHGATQRSFTAVPLIETISIEPPLPSTS